MISLSDLLNPVSDQEFYARYYDREPLHIPASEAGKNALFGWADFNDLLNRPGQWTPQTLKMVHNTQPVAPERYGREVLTPKGRVLQPDPRKIELFLAQGASLVADDVGPLHPAIAQLSAGLSQEFAAQIGANIYCSFKGVQAFGPHLDLHHVFAVQMEGEKVWKIYRNRLPDPVEMPVPTQEAPAWFRANCGPVMSEITMMPGDVLYLPRGWFHDALAKDGPSLHVTFSVTPLYGRILFSLLENAAMQDADFRQYFPPASRNGGRDLQAHLTKLGQKLAALCAHPAFRDEVAMAQTRLVPRPGRFNLPEVPTPTLYRVQPLAPPPFSGPVAHAMQYAYSLREFTIEHVIALYDFVPEGDIRAAVERAVAAGSLKQV